MQQQCVQGARAAAGRAGSRRPQTWRSICFINRLLFICSTPCATHHEGEAPVPALGSGRRSTAWPCTHNIHAPLSPGRRRGAVACRTAPPALGSGKCGVPRSTGNNPTSSFAQSSAVVAGLSIASSVLKITDLAPSRSSPAARQWLAWSGCQSWCGVDRRSELQTPYSTAAGIGRCLPVSCMREAAAHA
jgi:hypothetical protein